MHNYSLLKSNPLQNTCPVTFCKWLESEEVLQSELSVLWIHHPDISRCMSCYSRTSQDLSLSSGVLTSEDGVAQLFGDWDEIEDRASAGHSDAGDGHGV